MGSVSVWVPGFSIMKICQPWIYICAIETEQWNEMNSPLSHKWNMAVVANESPRAVRLRSGLEETTGRLRSSERGEGNMWLKCEAIPSRIHLHVPNFKEKAVPHSTTGRLRNRWGSVVLKATEIRNPQGEDLMCGNGVPQKLPVLTESRGRRDLSVQPIHSPGAKAEAQKRRDSPKKSQRAS